MTPEKGSSFLVYFSYLLIVTTALLCNHHQPVMPAAAHLPSIATPDNKEHPKGIPCAHPDHPSNHSGLQCRL